MTESHEINGVHVNHHQRDTLKKLLAHPTSHNLHWKEVIHLAEALGAVEERHDGKVKLTIGGSSEVFDPNHKDLSMEQIADLRRMIKAAGFDN
ncbi:MAG: hypothetical protein K9G05_01945 [Candidatus Nanopelagicales bacterium]|nr:hypothetical protein [Candidatus Nanopelagicales bacterium]MCF8538707.1 hypothetical protein [Candidatus Nanopelagicales bacterium]MCF8550826.1 hypothetical protein [Candidatus Nanopelagicales bacterium]